MNLVKEGTLRSWELKKLWEALQRGAICDDTKEVLSTYYT